MMDQRSIKPGMIAASLAGKFHPRTGELLRPVGVVNGVELWPVIGGDGDSDEDDSRFTGDDDDDDDSDDDDDDSGDDDDSDDGKDKKKSKKDDDDSDDDKPKYTETEMYAVKRRMRRADQRSSRLEAELKDLRAKVDGKKDTSKKDTDTPVESEELKTLRKRNEELEHERQQDKLEKAFSRVPLPKGKEWVDVEDAIAAAQRLGLLEDAIEDDGTVDPRSLKAALRELLRKKPHLVQKVSDPNEDDDDSDDDRRSSAPSMNRKRKGDRTTADRAALAKRFPVLGRS